MKKSKPKLDRDYLFIVLMVIGGIFSLLMILGIIVAIVLTSINPQLQIQKGKCASVCVEKYQKTSLDYGNCMNSCAQLK